MAITAAASTTGVIATAAPASADLRSCGGSTYIEQIQVQDWGSGQFMILVYPKAEARAHSAAASLPRTALDHRDAVVDEWHAIQACVPGLYGDLADSIWQQLDCHQRLAWAYNPITGTWATGSTFDLESWRPKLGDAWLGNEAWTRCLNALGVNPAAPVSSPYRPDAGQTDLYGAYAGIA